MDVKARRDFMCKERIVDIEFKISRLGILGKAYYDLAQIKLKRHRNQISIAKTQNSLLHAALDTLREKDRIARKNAGDLENLAKKAATLRLQFDHQRQRVFKRQRKLEWQITGTHSTELECAQVLDPNTPPEVIIRTLEYKIARVRIKFQDVQILVRQYEATLQPLREEWITYDAKLAVLQDNVTIKNHQCELLINSHHDAVRARDAAKIELEELLAYVFHYGKKGLISPDLRLKILRAIKEIKSVMDVGSMREMYHQFLVQEKQTSYLESIYEDMKRTLDLMKDSDDYQRTRRKSSIKDPHYASRVIGGSIVIVRRHSSLKGSFPLVQILEGTQRLVDRLQEGHITVADQTVEKEVLEKCKHSMVQILQALHLQLKRRNKEAVRKAEFEAKEAAHWAREEAEVARKKKAAEDARRKYEERQAAREAQREAEEIEREQEREALLELEEMDERPQIREKLQAAPSQTQGDDFSSSLEESTAPRDTVPSSAPSGNEYLLSSYYQLAKETTEDMPAPTVIFLPTFQQAPSDSDKHIGLLDVRRQEVTTAALGVSSVSSDDESSADASAADDGTHGPRIIPSEVTEETLPETGQKTGSSTSVHVAEPPDIEAASRRGQTEVTLESTKVVLQDDEKVVTIGESGLIDVKGTLSVVGELPIAGPTPSGNFKETIEAQTTQEVTDLSREPSRDEPTSSMQGGSPEQEGPPVEQPLSSELTPAAEQETGISTVDSARPEITSCSVGISDQLSTTQSRLASSQLALGESSAVRVALSGDERPEDEGMAPEKLQEAASSESATGGPTSSTTISDDGHEKAAEQKIEGSPISAVPVILSSENVGSQAHAPEATSKEPGSLSATVGIAMHSDQRAAPREEKGTPAVPVQLMDVPSTASPGDQAQPLPMPTASGAEILSKREEAPEVLPSSPEAGPETAEIWKSSQTGVSGDDRLEQRSHDTEVRAAEVLRSTPTELPGAAGTSRPRGSGVSGVESAAQTPRPVEVRLPRSPSGAPIASGARVPPIETVSIDESLPQRPSGGGLRSPNMPRSPSGAPVATSPAFPFGEGVGQRPERSISSETSTPLAASSSGTSGTPSDTARLPATSLGEPAPTEATLPEKGSEPGAAGTSDSPTGGRGREGGESSQF